MSRLELIGPDGNALRVHTGMLSVSVECAGADITAQLRGTGGGDGFLDAAHAAKLFEGGLPDNDAQDGWVLPVHIGNKRVVYTLRIDLGRELVVRIFVVDVSLLHAETDVSLCGVNAPTGMRL